MRQFSVSLTCFKPFMEPQMGSMTASEIMESEYMRLRSSPGSRMKPWRLLTSSRAFRFRSASLDRGMLALNARACHLYSLLIVRQT